MSKMIPTVGDVVVFYPDIMDKDCLTNNKSPHEGVPAIVTTTFQENMVNLVVFPDCGETIHRTSIDKRPGEGILNCWDWVDEC